MVSQDYEKKAAKLDSHVLGDDNTPFQDKLKTFGVNGWVLGPTVGAWCETSTDFDLLVELIAHVLADEETSTIQVAHNQSDARKKCKLVADFGVRMHLAWTQHLLDNREFVQMKGRFPSSGPRSGQGNGRGGARPVPAGPVHECRAQSPRGAVQPTCRCRRRRRRRWWKGMQGWVR